MGRVIGIDLGTTFSAAACVNEHGKPEIIPNVDSDRITPSVILFDDDSTVVGKTARQQSVAAPEQVVAFVKRQMGKSVDEYSRTFAGKRYSADELAAIILKKIKQDAEACLHEEVTDAVITVPAYFGDSQRAATTNAGTIAGLNVVQLLNEPTAAAIAYGMDKLGTSQRVFVFDLGGGTFDVTLMEVAGSTIRMLQTNGNHQLGGKDWDDAIALHIADRFQTEHGVDPLADAHSAQDLQLNATAAKEVLTQRVKTRIVCGHGGKTTRVELTREAFEALTASKVDQCQDLCEIVLNDAEMTWSDIDTVLLAGGSTRMPMIGDMLRRLTGKEISLHEVNLDEVVALGAAIHGTLRQIKAEPAESVAVAAALTERYGSTDMQVIDGATHPLGAIARRSTDQKRVNFVLIPKMEPVPCRKTDGFSTIGEDQRVVKFPVVQGLPDGQAEMPGIKFADYTIGELELDLPPGLPAGSPISVTYEYTADQTLEVSAEGPGGRTAKTTINRQTLNAGEVTEAAEAMSRLTVE